MASVNKVIIVGNLGADPEIRYLPSGDAVASLRVATTDKWKDKQSGEMRENTEWHSISFFGRLAEVAGEYLKKGSQVYVEGSLRTRKYTDKNGVEKYATDIKGDTLQMLGSRQGGERSGSSGERQQGRPDRNAYADAKNRAQPQRQPAGGSSGFDDMDDDIPF